MLFHITYLCKFSCFNEELLRLRQQVKELEKEIRLLKKENDFLEEASAFFAASRLKSAKTKE